MVPWKRISASDTREVFSRPLGGTEAVFYWDSVFNGVNDILIQIVADVKDSHASRIFSRENVMRTWLILKSIHPLLGASIHERDDTNIHFVVDETRLTTMGRDEIIFSSVESDVEALALIQRIQNGSRTLSNERPLQVWIISLPQNRPDAGLKRYHVLFLTAHCVCDGGGLLALIPMFFDILSNAETPDVYIPKDSLERRLKLNLAMEDLSPSRNYTAVRQRWRRAIAHAIYSRRKAALRGGHSLPQTITPQTFVEPAISRALRVTLPVDVTRRIMESCQCAGVTLGAALPVLSQLAFSRILQRLHNQGTISAEEWSYRQAQPMHMSGVINLRPYLDRGWLKSGGAHRVGVATAPGYGTTLPFMPVARESAEPGFANIFSRTEFLHRCRDSQRQTKKFLNHPLLLEITQLIRHARLESAKETALQWRAQQESGGKPTPRHCTASYSQATKRTGEYVLSNICATLANYDKIAPSEYPAERHRSPREDAPSTKPSTQPLVRLISVINHQRCEPTELYLNAMTFQGVFQLVCYCDVRVYDEELVMEWLVEVGRAAEWYLGGDDTSAWARL